MSKPDVTITYAKNGQTLTKILLGADKINSREAYGIWKVDTNKAWKVFRTRNQLDKLSADYARADLAAALPMGNPSFMTCKVQIGKDPSTDGFVLITDWMDGTNFQKGNNRPFKAALQTQKVPTHANDQTYIKVRRGCEAADKVGLKDCQGYVYTALSSAPIRFIDIHTSYIANTKPPKFSTSGEAEELLDTIKNWAK